MSLHISSRHSLLGHNSLAIDAHADTFIDIRSIQDLAEVARQFPDQDYLILGGGSNLLLDQPVIQRPVLWINLRGIEILQDNDDEVIVRAMAGENWHEFVLWCLKHDLGGLENLSLIPGSVGAAPIQNIGAYGVEVRDVLQQVEVFNLSDGNARVFSTDECQLSYRDSIFKHPPPGSQWVITAVAFRLTRKRHQLKLDYGAIQQTLEAAGITQPTIRDVSEAVIQIRRQRLPDPAETPNAGSFFKNPVVARQDYRQLLATHPDMPGYDLPGDQVKIPAAWLIEQCGWKGKRLEHCGVHAQHALVLINHDHASAAELLDLARQIQLSVRQRFGLLLAPEVNLGSGAVLS